VAGVNNKNLKLKRVVHKKGITVKTVWLSGPGFPTHYPKTCLDHFQSAHNQY